MTCVDSCSTRSGQTQRKTASLAQHTFNRHCPTHRLDPLFDKRETKARAAAHASAASLSLVEAFPDVRQVSRCDTLSRVFDMDNDFSCCLQHRHSDDTAGGGMAHSDVEEDLQGLLQEAPIE